MNYDPYQINQELLDTMHKMYPGFTTLACVFSGESGTGKSTLAAATPLPKGTKRLVLDFEDSMKYLDAGVEGEDIYTPNRQTFSMRRVRYPDVPQMLMVYTAIAHPPADQKYKYGALIIDNIAVMQDRIVEWMISNAHNPASVRKIWSAFDQPKALPVDSVISKWANFQDPAFWNSIKAIPRALMSACSENGLHLVATTETNNVWSNYNQAGAKILGKKAKMWDVWYRYIDFALMLSRDVNSREAPTVSLSPYQPKMRLQNLNPKFRGDWQGIIDEIKSSVTRTEKEIPLDKQVTHEDILEAPADEVFAPPPSIANETLDTKDELDTPLII